MSPEAQLVAAARQAAAERAAARPVTSAIMVRGRLRDDAHLRTSADGSAVFLFAVVDQRHGLPYLGIQRFDGDPTSVRAAHAKRRVLGKGTEVAIYGTGLELDRVSFTPSELVLRVQGNADIRPIALPSRHDAPAEATEAGA